MEKSRKTAFVEDAKKLATLAEYAFTKDTTLEIPTVGDNRCIIMKLSYLDQTDLSTGPNDGTYDTDLSYVKISYGADDKYQYVTQLVERKDNVYAGVIATPFETLTAEGAINENIFRTGTSSLFENPPSCQVMCDSEGCSTTS